MSILDEIQTGMNPGPIKMNIAGTDGIGKTTFAAGAPSPIFIKTEEGTTEEEISEETHVVLSYPERVPNAEKGADHAHAYIMIKVLGILIIFSLVIAKFTSPF